MHDEDMIQERQKEKAGVVFIFLATLLVIMIAALRIFYPDQYDIRDLLGGISIAATYFMVMGITMIPNKTKC